MPKKIFIAAFQQSKFGKLMGMTIPGIVDTAVRETFSSIGADPALAGVASIGACCAVSRSTSRGSSPASWR